MKKSNMARALMDKEFIERSEKYFSLSKVLIGWMWIINSGNSSKVQVRDTKKLYKEVMILQKEIKTRWGVVL